VLITGATGTLGQALARVCAERHLGFHLTSRAELDIANPVSAAAALDRIRPWAVINAAGFVRVDDAERCRDKCDRENCVGPAVLAELCRRRGIQFVTFSSDLVFDGESSRPYVESDAVRPLGVYGMSKVVAERIVLERMPDALIVRTSAFFGPWDDQNFAAHVIATLGDGRSVVVANDQTVSPTYVPDLAGAVLDLLIDEEMGIWHVANGGGALTWYQFACDVANAFELDVGLIDGQPSRSLGLVAARPRFSALGSERGVLLPNVSDALSRYVHSVGAKSISEARRFAVRGSLSNKRAGTCVAIPVGEASSYEGPAWPAPSIASD
jgi:dTDP-4-dehydrorhamnose reductase